MIRWPLILLFLLPPVFLFSQVRTDSSRLPSYSVMFNLSTLFYTAQDQRINNFLSKYHYVKPPDMPVGLRFEIAIMPAGGKMIYGINAGTVISRQDIVTADISLGAYYRFFETKRVWFVSGLAIGEHFDRIVLNGSLPPALDSLSKKYDATLSLHRNGLIAEPALKIFWYPVKNKKMQLGLFAGVYYDFDFNSHWRVGYYAHDLGGFKNLRKPTQLATVQEFGWVFSSGLSICF
jgi:hypothetical protein